MQVNNQRLPYPHAWLTYSLILAGLNAGVTASSAEEIGIEMVITLG